MDNINYGKTTLLRDIEAAEARYNAKYVGDFCLKTIGGNWSESPAAIFWQETPPNPAYSNYFGLVIQFNELYITDGSSAFAEPIVGLVAKNGEIVYSRYRHDFRSSTDGSVSIDGGRDYTRIVGDYAVSAPQVYLRPNGVKLEVIPENELPKYFPQD